MLLFFFHSINDSVFFLLLLWKFLILSSNFLPSHIHTHTHIAYWTSLAGAKIENFFFFASFGCVRWRQITWKTKKNPNFEIDCLGQQKQYKCISSSCDGKQIAYTFFSFLSIQWWDSNVFVWKIVRPKIYLFFQVCVCVCVTISDEFL